MRRHPCDSFDDDRIDADRATVAFRATEPDISAPNIKMMLERLFGNAKAVAAGKVSSLGDAKSSLGDAKSSLGAAESSLGDAESSLSDAERLAG
jgi:hypothetical protein